jgi:mono/diheme cytochrome c family protein
VDLSTAAAWLEGRDEIGERVLRRRTMPPAGRPLSEDDRAAIAAWLRGPPAASLRRPPQAIP